MSKTQPLPANWFRTSPTSHTPALRTCRTPESQAVTQRIEFVLADQVAIARGVRS